MSLILALLGTACVLVVTYYASRWYARRMGPAASGKHLKLIDRVPLSKSSSVCIMELSGRQYLMGVSETHVQILKELEEPVKPLTEISEGKENFQQLLQSFTRKKES
jgi:flagellar protein FliO/FliZ